MHKLILDNLLLISHSNMFRSLNRRSSKSLGVTKPLCWSVRMLLCVSVHVAIWWLWNA